VIEGLYAIIPSEGGRVTSLVIGVWVGTLGWLATGFVIFTFAIARPMRDRGVNRPFGFHPPAFIGNHSRELTAYRMQRRRSGRSIFWWRFMMAWRVLFALLTISAFLITFAAALEIF
jgi:hypothetical protein